MKNNYLEWNGIMWNKLVFFWIKMNEQECSRSVPIRNVSLHRKDFGGLGEQSEDLHVWWIQIHYEVYWGGVRVCVCQWQYIEMETWSGERSAELVSTSETRNPKPTVKVGFELRNPKPETRNRLWRLNFPRTDRNPKPETRNRLWRLTFPRTDRNPKPETDSEDLTSPDRSKPETRNPKTETRNPKPTVKVGFELRNPKPETDSEDLTSPDRSKPETRKPKPETDC